MIDDYKIKQYIHDYDEGNYIWWIGFSYKKHKNVLCSIAGVKHFHWVIKNYIDI